MSILNSLGTVQVRRAGTRCRFEEAGRFVLQVTRVEEFETRKQAEKNKRKVEEDKEFSTRLSFNVLEIEDHPELRNDKGEVIREAGKASAPVPGSEPEIALFPDEFDISAKTLLAFLMAAQGLTEKETNSLTMEKVRGWYDSGELENQLVRVDFVSKAWKGNGKVYHNPVAWYPVAAKNLSKAAKAKLIS